VRGTYTDFVPHRIRGRRSLVARLQRLAIAAHRYGCHRAATDADRAFAARLFDGLRETLDRVEEDR